MTIHVSLSDQSYGTPCHINWWISDELQAPRAKYTLVGEAMRIVIPEHMQCLMGCGGQACKYDNPSYWSEDQQAIKGLYSSWVTDQLLAMSRPSTEIIETYNLIDQFKRSGIKTLINLQRPGEHATCGNPLERESGFSYRPEVFMENDIYFYNFCWEDYGVANLTAILDMVKVMAFAMQDGKIAIHCHAGLGRTGVLIACFLAYGTKMTADQAIVFVRAKRPDAIQTRGQLQCVREFVKFLTPIRTVFSCAAPRSKPVTLSQYLNRQRHMLHGSERRELRNLPKIVRLVCRLLVDIAENRQVIEEDILEAPDSEDIEMIHNTIDMLSPQFNEDHLRLPGPPTLPRHFNEPALFYHRKSLSYSESDLRRLGSELNLLGQPLTSLSESNVHASWLASRSSHYGRAPQTESGGCAVVSSNSASSLWEQKNNVKQDEGTCLMNKARKKERSESVGSDDNKGSVLSRWSEMKKHAAHGDKEEADVSEVPFITLQSELSAEARRLLVAQALAVDLFQDGEEGHKRTVLAWQAELNQGGAWERLCLERDPFILTGLMWAWLEQLKEPVISLQAAKALKPDSADTQALLNTLELAPKETLTCILDCMANMRKIPEEVKNAFLKRTIKAFTHLQTNTQEEVVYESITNVLHLVLLDMTSTITENDIMMVPVFHVL